MQGENQEPDDINVKFGPFDNIMNVPHHSTCCSTWCVWRFFFLRKLFDINLLVTSNNVSEGNHNAKASGLCFPHHPAVAIAHPNKMKSTITADTTVMSACPKVSLNLHNSGDHNGER